MRISRGRRVPSYIILSTAHLRDLIYSESQWILSDTNQFHFLIKTEKGAVVIAPFLEDVYSGGPIEMCFKFRFETAMGLDSAILRFSART